jgi:hypothetical protein
MLLWKAFWAFWAYIALSKWLKALSCKWKIWKDWNKIDNKQNKTKIAMKTLFNKFYITKNTFGSFKIRCICYWISKKLMKLIRLKWRKSSVATRKKSRSNKWWLCNPLSNGFQKIINFSLNKKLISKSDSNLTPLEESSVLRTCCFLSKFKSIIRSSFL